VEFGTSLERLNWSILVQIFIEMRSLVLSILFLFFGFQTDGFAQDCKYEIEEVDAFTKSKKLLTKNVSLWNPGNGNSFGIKGKYESGQKAFVCRYVFNTEFTIAEGADIIFLFEDDTSLSLDAQGESVAKSAPEKRLYKAQFTLVMNEEQVAMLSEKAVTAIRITAKERNFDRAIKPQHSKRIQEILKCIE